ncbi:glucose import [Tritrichomonas musculus]|uniref:Glucose import n=1 Tax=Tritrichomonas musculus TaxID=1915356 RepID=A0ABR2K953_9EUKA
MICNRNIYNVLIILLLPIQYSFQTDLYTNLLLILESKWKTENKSIILIYAIKFSVNIAAIVFGIAGIFIYYRIRNRKLFISIGFIINSIVYFSYFCINEERLWVLIILRTFNGIFLGLFDSITIFYLYHFVSSNYQAFFGYLIQTVMFLGLVLMSLILYALRWQYLVVILGIQCLLISGLIWIIPEISIPQKSITHDYITSKNHRFNLFILVFIMLLQQFSGIGTCVNNVPRMLTGIGLDIDNHLQKALMNSIGCLSTFIGSFATVTISRNYLWALSSLGMCAALIIYSITLMSNIGNWVGTFGVFLFFTFYGLGQGPIPWLLCGELFPESVRIESGAITITVNMLLGLIFHFVNESITDSADEFGSIMFNAAMNFVAMFVGLFLIPVKRNEYYYNDNLM